MLHVQLSRNHPSQVQGATLDHFFRPTTNWLGVNHFSKACVAISQQGHIKDTLAEQALASATPPDNG